MAMLMVEIDDALLARARAEAERRNTTVEYQAMRALKRLADLDTVSYDLALEDDEAWDRAVESLGHVPLRALIYR
jgi:hypothetical protein